MGADEQQEERSIFTAADIAVLGNTVGHRWVRMPEWDKKAPETGEMIEAWVVVWGTTQREDIRIADEVQMVMKDDQSDQSNLKAEARRRIATVIQCTRDGDADDAKLVFSQSHWEWLEKQPTAAIDRILSVVQELDAASPAVQEQLQSFFGIARMHRVCWQRIVSACGCCTDCPESSRQTCPIERLGSLLPPTESLERTNTDGSVMSADNGSEENRPA